MGARKRLVVGGSDLYIGLFPVVKTFTSQTNPSRFWFLCKSSYWEKLLEQINLEIFEGCSLQGDGLQ